MADVRENRNEPCSNGSLDHFLLDEPWKPVSYLSDEEEAPVQEPQNPELCSLEEKNFSNLFQMNTASIQSDIQKVRSASIDQGTTPPADSLVYDIENEDDNNLQKYISYGNNEDHLSVLDSTITINKKSIVGDIEKLRKFKIASIDEDPDIGFEDDIPTNSHDTDEAMGNVDKNNKIGKNAVSSENSVDKILDLLPDLENILHDPSDLEPNNFNEGSLVKNDEVEDNELDILGILKFPEIPSFSNNLDNTIQDDGDKDRDESSSQQSLEDDGIEILPSEPSAMSKEMGKDYDKVQDELSNEKSQITQSELTDISQNGNDPQFIDNSQDTEKGIGDNVENLSHDTLPMSLLKENQSTEELKEQPAQDNGEQHETLTNEEPSQTDNLAACTREDEDENDVNTNVDSHEISSALIADLLLAEQSCRVGDASEEEDISTQPRNEPRLELAADVNESSLSCQTTTDTRQIDATDVTGASLVPMYVDHGESGSPDTTEVPTYSASIGDNSHTPSRDRGPTDASSGSEDLDEFVREQYQPNTVSSDAQTTSSDQITLGNAQDVLSQNDTRLGLVPPKWIPDKDAKACMHCSTKFTVVKRRHHCRACGKVLCAGCCNMKFNLQYMNFKPARVCQVCCDTLIRVQNSLACRAGTSTTSRGQNIPTIPEQYDSDGGSPASPHHTSMLPASGESPPSYQQSTTFQGPIVGGASPTSSASRPFGQNFYPVNRNSPHRIRADSEVSAVIMFNSSQTNLPPIIRENHGVTKIVNSPDLRSLFEQMHEKGRAPVVFLVNKNLIVRAKIVHLDCCVGKVCWCFCTDGMGASNQEEIVIVNEYHGDDVSAIKCVLQQLNYIFEKAKQGSSVGDLGCITFNNQMALNPNLTSMLFFKASLQCTQNLIKPSSPFLFGQYLHTTEICWGKVYPMRIFLRLGYEYKSYPCPLYNDINREAVYSSGTRTIVNLLADLRNYQYGVQKITGVTVMLKNKDTILRLPQNRYDEVLKLVNTAEDNVLCFGGNFNAKTDSYLIALGSDNGFSTETVNTSKKSRKTTLASFLVFSASLKPSQDGIVAKTSIVEDGIMVQITADLMKVIRSAIKDMKDHTVDCGTDDLNTGKLIVEWTSGEPSERSRHKSPVDGMTLNNLTNMKIRHSYDYTGSTNPCKIHWMEVYFLPNDGNTVDRLSARELGQMTSSVAKACMEALRPHLGTLCELKMNWIGLRVGLDADSVEYKIGSNLQTLPDELTKDLDDKLIPAIHGVLSNLPQGKIQVELIFQVVRIV